MTGFLALNAPPPPPRPSGPRVAPSDSYSAAALKGEIDKVLYAPEGTRNHTLFTATAALGEFINAGTLDEDTVRDSLADAARSSGLAELEIEPTINSALRKVAGVARTVPERSLGLPPQTGTESASESFSVGGTAPRTLGDRLLTPTGLRTLPEPKPLIDNVLDQGTTALLYGKWASSKSFIALDWACSVATGHAWQGRPTERARVLYVVAEGVAGFAGRVDAWEVGWRTKIDDHWMRFLPMSVNLMMANQVDHLANLVERGEYGFVILDTLARCMVGGDENSARDAGIAIDSVTQLMYATPNRRGVVLGVHHTGKDGRTLRGSSAFESGVDTVYFTERDGATVSLRRTKRKDGPESDVHRLRLADIVGTSSCIVEALPGENNGDDSESLADLKKLFSEMFSETGVTGTELRTIAADHGMSQSSFYRARTELLRQGWLINTGSGPRSFFEMANQEEKNKELLAF